MQRLCTLGLAALALSGCASIFSGTTQDVVIRSTPGAKYVVTNSFGTQVADGNVGDDAAAKMNLVRGAGYFSPHSYKVKLSKPGYHPATVDINPGVNGWYFANIAIGGVVGMVIVDPLTGAMFRLVPSAEDVPLTPTGEDLSSIEFVQDILAKTRDYPISRHDYTARAKVRSLNCSPVGNPEIVGRNTFEERLTFACNEGRTQVVVCRSSDGCLAG